MIQYGTFGSSFRREKGEFDSRMFLRFIDYLEIDRQERGPSEKGWNTTR